MAGWTIPSFSMIFPVKASIFGGFPSRVWFPTAAPTCWPWFGWLVTPWKKRILDDVGRLTLNRKCLVVSMIYDMTSSSAEKWLNFRCRSYLGFTQTREPRTFLLFGRLCHSATRDGSGVPSWQRSNTISPITWVTSGQVLSHPGRLPTRTNSDSATYVDSATNDSSTYPVGFSNEYGRIQQQMWSDSATNPIQKLMIRKPMFSDPETNSFGFRNWRFPIQKRSRIQKLIHRNISFRMQVQKFPVIHLFSKTPRSPR